MNFNIGKICDIRANFARAVFASALFFGIAESSHAARDSVMMPGDVLNFELPSFNEKTGWKEWEFFGNKAKYVSDKRIDIENLRVKIFEGENILKVTLESEFAELNPETRRATSSKTILAHSDNFNLEGKVWEWAGVEKIVWIYEGVKIKFHNPDSAKEEKQASKSSDVFDVKAPSDIFTESVFAKMSYGGSDNVFEFKNSVKVHGKDMEIFCDELFLEAKKGSGEGENVKDVLAKGNVRVISQQRDAKSGQARVNMKKNSILFEIDPALTDLQSGAALVGDIIEIAREEKKVLAYSSKDKLKRANAVFTHKNDKGEAQTIIVMADVIEMSAGSEENIFDFKGDVKVIAPDFGASCGKLRALAKNSEKPEIISIVGEKNIKLSNESGDAFADLMEIFPDKSEIHLKGNARLTDPENGVKLSGSLMVFERAKNRGKIFSDETKKNSRVVAVIPENAESLDILGGMSPSEKDSKTKKTAPLKKENTLIKSRELEFSRSGTQILLLFKKEVEIKSSNMSANCELMEVYAENDGSEKLEGTANIRKIVAKQNVVMTQQSCIARTQIAEIYPKVDLRGAENEKVRHRYAELFAPENEPEKRPEITLPSIGSIGLNPSQDFKASQRKNTVISSDRQWLSSSGNIDRYFFEGNVKVDGSDMSAECGKIEVIMKSARDSEKKRITQIVMTENVKLSQGLRDATCGRADIYTEDEMVVLSQNPSVINREDNTRATGYRMIYNRGTKGVVLEGEDAKRPAETSPSASQPSARPTIVLPQIKNVRRRN